MQPFRRGVLRRAFPAQRRGPALGRAYSGAPPASSPSHEQGHEPLTPAAFASLRSSMLARSPRYLWDRLTPLRAHLLDQALADFLAVPGVAGSGAAGPSFDPHDAREPPALRLSSSAASALRPGQHLVYFPPQALAASRLLADGTEPEHAPPAAAGFASRVWYGGRIEFSPTPPSPASSSDPSSSSSPAPPRQDGGLRLDGGPAVCREAVADVRLREGKGGRHLVLVDVERLYYAATPQDGGGDGRVLDADAIRAAGRGPVIAETRTLAFAREAPEAAARTGVLKPPDATNAVRVSLTPDAALLFHFSALTMNAHAIHLDRAHCRDVEGYRNLLVHGPLSLYLMLDVLRRATAAATQEEEDVVAIEYRNLAKLYADEEMVVCAKRLEPAAEARRGEAPDRSRWKVWVEGADGGMAVSGTAYTRKRMARG